MTDRENVRAAAFWRDTIMNIGYANLVEHPRGIGDWTGPSWTFDVPQPTTSQSS